MAEPCATPTTAPVTGPTTPWWKQLLTGKNNETWDLGRISWTTCTVSTLVKEVVATAQGKGSSLRDFAIALATITAAHGIVLGLKAHTEPDGGN